MAIDNCNLPHESSALRACIHDLSLTVGKNDIGITREEHSMRVHLFALWQARNKMKACLKVSLGEMTCMAQWIIVDGHT